MQFSSNENTINNFGYLGNLKLILLFKQNKRHLSMVCHLLIIFIIQDLRVRSELTEPVLSSEENASLTATPQLWTQQHNVPAR